MKTPDKETLAKMREVESAGHWEPIPCHFLSKAVYKTLESACQAMRAMYPRENRPDLWAKYSAVFGGTA